MNFEIEHTTYGAFVYKIAKCKCGWESRPYISVVDANNAGWKHDIEDHNGKRIREPSERTEQAKTSD